MRKCTVDVSTDKQICRGGTFVYVKGCCQNSTAVSCAKAPVAKRFMDNVGCIAPPMVCFAFEQDNWMPCIVPSKQLEHCGYHYGRFRALYGFGCLLCHCRSARCMGCRMASWARAVWAGGTKSFDNLRPCGAFASHLLAIKSWCVFHGNRTVSSLFAQQSLNFFWEVPAHGKEWSMRKDLPTLPHRHLNSLGGKEGVHCSLSRICLLGRGH